MSKVTINQDLCEKCGTCVLSCPETVFEQKEKKSIPDIIHEDLCFSCGHCVAICPQEAITHRDFPQGRVNQINLDIIPSPEQVFELMKTRRSIRAFKDKPVERDLIEQIIAAARYAPSGHNAQSTEFVVVQEKENLEKIVGLTQLYLTKTAKQFRNPLIKNMLLMVAKYEVEGGLHLINDFDRVIKEYNDGKDTILFSAPCVLFFHADKSINFSDVNSSLAVQNAMLLCHSLGLGCFYAGYVVSACKRDSSIPDLLSIPKKNQVYGALAMGYPKFKYKKWIERRPARIEWK
jgi:nitroreductase/NAD-dependent dihydropyrimidine dehydrogenase PreA subunit